MNQNSVIFKGRNGGIHIILDEKILFEDLKTIFREKVSEASAFFGDTNISITFKGRDLTELEESELLNIISEVSGLNISFVHGKDETPMLVKQQKLDKLETTLNIKEPKIQEKQVDLPIKTIFSAFENVTSFHKGSIRSGQALRFKGSIVIIGDVNPGGEVIAEGNVIVLGTIKGLVHAGCAGCADCFVIALNLKPTQLRIADIVTYFSEKDKKTGIVPECPFAKNGEIYVETLTNF